VLISGPNADGDVDVWASGAKEMARRIAVLNQERSDDFELSVWEVVLTGRTPHKRLLERDSAADHLLVAALLAKVGMDSAAGRYFSSLSGGEKQRVLLAKALAQQTEVLLLDEPTNHLDVAAQCALLDLLRERVEDDGLTAVAVLHDLNLAAAYTDYLVVMGQGKIVAAGPPADVLTEQIIDAVFGVRAHCGVHPATGDLHVAVHMGGRSKRARPPSDHRVPEPRSAIRRVYVAPAATSASCVPISATRPPLSTTSRSAVRIVDSRWAITSTVLPRRASAIAAVSSSSLSASRFETGSSMTRIGLSLRTARASAIRWRWPPDSFAPRSPNAIRWLTAPERIAHHSSRRWPPSSLTSGASREKRPCRRVPGASAMLAAALTTRLPDRILSPTSYCGLVASVTYRARSLT
jgi:iron complex transport system ATP-binding protein